jgi:hypothetical protein
MDMFSKKKRSEIMSKIRSNERIRKLRFFSEKPCGNRVLDTERTARSILASPILFCRNIKQRFLLIPVFGIIVRNMVICRKVICDIGRKKSPEI